MSDLSKPLYTLTIGEYKELQKEIFKEQFQQLQNHGKLPLLHKQERDIIFIDDACEITGYSKPTMYFKISRYEIPVLSRGKPLTFSKKEIIEWIHQGKPNIMDKKVEEHLKQKR